ncbi:MAG: HAD family hydrolase [Candidatus Nanoarchaeia archaeon]
MTYSAYIFDQDGTFYPKNHPLTLALRTKTKEWIKNSLNISQTEIDKIYHDLPLKYAHPYIGFESLGLSAKDYLSEVFDKTNPATHIFRNEELISILSSIKPPKFVVTLASLAYSSHLQKTLGINNALDRTFSAINQERPYSKKQIYIEICKNIHAEPSTVMVIGDNYELDIVPAIELGMNYKHLVDENIVDVLKNIQQKD